MILKDSFQSILLYWNYSLISQLMINNHTQLVQNSKLFIININIMLLYQTKITPIFSKTLEIFILLPTFINKQIFLSNHLNQKLFFSLFYPRLSSIDVWKVFSFKFQFWIMIHNPLHTVFVFFKTYMNHHILFFGWFSKKNNYCICWKALINIFFFFIIFLIAWWRIYVTASYVKSMNIPIFSISGKSGFVFSKDKITLSIK